MGFYGGNGWSKDGKGNIDWKFLREGVLRKEIRYD